MKRFNPSNIQGKAGTHRWKKVFVLLLVSITFFTAVSANHEFEKKTVELGNPTKITINKKYTDFNSKQVSIVVPSSYNPKNIRGTSPQTDLDCSYRETFGKEIVCRPEKEVEENLSVEIVYTTDGVSERGKFHTYEHQKRILEPTDKYTLEVILPEGYGIISEDEGTPITPENAATGSEGRKIFVRWKMDNLTLGDSLDFKVNYQELNVFRNVFPGSMASMIGIVILLIAVILAVYIKYMKDEDTIASILPVLKKDEKRVIMYMLDYEGECEQVELVQNLEYSKAKISRLVKDLGERGIIKKIKEGRKNRLVIKKAIGEIEEDER